MKRLLHIAADIATTSIISSITWIIISLLVDKNLINIFIITYPLQFIISIIKSGLSVGANIEKEKTKNKKAVPTGMIVGSILGLLLFGFIIVNIDNYLNFMNADINIYKTFSIYVIVQLYSELILKFVINNYYFKSENKKASKILIIYNIIKLTSITLMSLIFKNQSLIVITSVLPILIYSFYFFTKELKEIKFDKKFLTYYKYDLEETTTGFFFMIIYMIGFSTIYSYDPKYALAIAFVSLVADVQWDVIYASATIAKIDISKNEFNYIKHKKNSYKLIGIMLTIGFLVYAILYQFYNVSLILILIYYSFDLISYLLFPIYKIKTIYLQLEHSVKIVTTNKFIANILRLIVSVLNTPFCTGLALLTSVTYQTITTQIIFKNNYKINKKGSVISKKML